LTDLLSIETLPTVHPTHDGVTSLTQRFQANNVTPLASSYLTYFGSNPQYAATIVEYRKGDGVVLNGGSVGWYRVLNTDVTSKIIFQNIIKFLLEADERVAR
jgi:hypothetical protein